MKVKVVVPFRSKLLKPCRKLIRILRFTLKKPLNIRPLTPRSHQTRDQKVSRRNRVTKFFCLFRSVKRAKVMDEVGELQSISNAESETLLFPSPITPAYIRAANATERLLFPSYVRPAYIRAANTSGRLLFSSPRTPAYIKAAKTSEASRQEDVADACSSFENYLMEMIVEEGKVRDLNDVEELLYCWKNLKSPVFIDLVSRFYGELCKDLFAPDDDSDDVDTAA